MKEDKMKPNNESGIVFGILGDYSQVIDTR